MPKTYTFTDIPKPANPSATAVAGGSLLPNTTYYYRIYKINISGSPYSYGRSIISDEFSVTTDATNKTARITFQSPKVAGQGYLIFRFTTPGQINIFINAVTFWPTDNAHNTGGTVVFDDTGYEATTGNTFFEDRDNPHGRLVLSGSTPSDKFSIEDLYNADVANGWGVILKLDENTYKVNTLLSMYGQYFDAVERTIIFADGIEYPGSWWLGRVSGTNRTYGGCNIIMKSNWLSSLNFTYLEAYRTSFQYVFPKNNGVDIAENGLGLCSISFGGNSIVQDCTSDRFRSFSPSNTSILKNVIVSRFDIAFNSSQATFNDVKCLSGSRVWQYAGNTHVTARGVYTEGTAVILLIGAGTSTITVIDSISDGSIIVNSSSTGFKLFDKISYNLTVVDSNGDGINTANVKMYDKDNNLLFNVNSNSVGVVVEQLLTWRDRTVNNLTAGAFVTYSPFKIVISKDGYETYEEKFSVLAAVPVVKIVSLKAAVPIRVSTDGASLALQPELGSSSLLKKI